MTVLQGQLRDLLTIARSDAAQLPTQVETFDLGELVQDVCAGLEEAAMAKGLAFQVEFPPSPVTVSADPIRTAQVLRNLVENSVRYTSTGRVRVRVEPFVSDASSECDAATTQETSHAVSYTHLSATPSPRTHRPAHHPINDTRSASQLSDLSPHRGARQCWVVGVVVGRCVRHAPVGKVLSPCPTSQPPQSFRLAM